MGFHEGRSRSHYLSLTVHFFLEYKRIDIYYHLHKYQAEKSALEYFCVVSFTDANVAKIFKVYTRSRKASKLEEINAHKKKDEMKLLIANLKIV